MQLLFPKRYIEYNQAMKWFEPITNNDNNKDIEKDIEKIYVFEHQDVYTAGKSINNGNDEKNNDKQFINKTPVFYTSRGGLWTWHGKGQVVVYFIYNLRKRNLALSNFMSLIEQAVIDATNQLLFNNLSNTQQQNKLQIYADSNKRGFWVKYDSTNSNNIAKFGFIGLRVSRGYVYHGISINFNNDLSVFDYINPCGLGDVKITSIEEMHNILIKKQKDKTTLISIDEFKKIIGLKLFEALNVAYQKDNSLKIRN